MKWLMTVSMIFALTALSCDRAKPRASVFKSDSGELTAIAAGVVFRGFSRDGQTASLKSVVASNRTTAEVLCVDGQDCQQWILNVYRMEGDDLRTLQFASDVLGVPPEMIGDKWTTAEYVGPQLSDEGRKNLRLAPIGRSLEDDELRLGPWLDLNGGGIAEGPVHTVERKNPDGTVIEIYGRLANGSPLPPKTATLKRISGEADTYSSGLMSSLLENSSASYAAIEPGAVVAVGEVTTREGGLNPPHSSHQNGLDADVAFVGAKGFSSVLDQNRQVIPAKFDAFKNWQYWRMLYSQKIIDAGKPKSVVSMILVSPEIKTYLCAWANENQLLKNPEDAEIMKRVRPTEGHDDHFHLRVHCSPHYPLCVKENYAPRETGC